jgi:hypothetical protein
MTRRRSIGRMPSATYLAVSAAMVNVLPVPALALETDLLEVQQPVPDQAGIDTEPVGLRRVEVPALLRRRDPGPREHVGERELFPQDEQVLSVPVLVVPLVPRFPFLARPVDGLAGVPPEGPFEGVGGGGLAEDRQGLAHAAQKDPDETGQMGPGHVAADLGVHVERADCGHGHGSSRALARPPDRLRLEGHLRVRRAQCQETQPRTQPQRGLHPAVGHHGDDGAAHTRH